LLADGCSIVAFPEGTRSGSRKIGPFHGSAFRLAQATGVPLVPLGIAGNERMPPRGSAILRPGRIVITKLPAVTKEQYEGMSPFQLKSNVRQTVQKHLNETERRGPLPGTSGEVESG
jgi:1-acyl-sn-glycerol-3-phosphate acyltransferase